MESGKESGGTVVKSLLSRIKMVVSRGISGTKGVAGQETIPATQSQRARESQARYATIFSVVYDRSNSMMNGLLKVRGERRLKTTSM